MLEKKVKFGILSLSMLSMATLTIAPVMGLIIQAFPGEGINKIQMILAVANLTGLVAAFVVGKMAMHVPKRTIALLGAFFTCVFGLIPYFAHDNLMILTVCSGLIGVSVGFITNVLPGLIADYFPVSERQAAMGKQVAFVSIGTMILMFLSGKLGAINWYSSYLTYLFAGLVFLIALFCIPKNESDYQHEGHGQHSIVEVLNKQVLSVALLGFCFMIVNNAFNNNLSIFIQQENMGGSDIAGLISMISQLGGLLAGFFMGKIVNVIKMNMVAAAFAVEGIALLLIAVANNIPMLIAASFLAGCGLSFFFAQAPFLITILVNPILIPMGMAVLSTANSLGGFLSPTIINVLNTMLIGSTARGAMLVGGVLSLVVAGVAFITQFQKKCLQKIEKGA